MGDELKNNLALIIHRSPQVLLRKKFNRFKEVIRNG